MTRSAPPPTAAVIGCDVVGHSGVDQRTQLRRIRGINRVVARAKRRHPDDCVLWASGGDGGHVLFLMDDWQGPALDLLRDLIRFTQRARIRLRIVAHFGPLVVFRGADGRLQPVGDAINTTGWILSLGSAAGIVVSSAFRTALGPMPGVELHDDRQLRLKHGGPLELWLMSLPRLGLRSRWSDAVEADRCQLRRAVDEGRGLDAVYYAKRLLQVNSVDEDVAEAMARLRSAHFRYRTESGEEDVNPILGHLDPASRRRVIGQGQLIERGYNEVLCRLGDTGNTMFVILRGQVGVYSPGDHDRPNPARPRATHSEGEIVGELAFALNRPRTADLVSLGDTALLSFEYEEVSKLLNGRGELLRDYMHGRALEHVSQRVPYLVGRSLTTLPEEERHSWLGTLGVLRSDCQIISRGRHQRITLADIRPAGDDQEGAGVYILAGGRLQSTANPEKRLDGGRFPLLYVDLPDLVVCPDHPYTVEEGPARIIFIGLSAIDELRHPVRARLVRQLKRAAPDLYHYDAFIACNFADTVVAEHWETVLRAAGLRVFRDTAEPGDAFAVKDGAALLDSLTMLVLVSRTVIEKPADRSWLLKEVTFRRRFDGQPRIVPIQLPGGDPQAIGLLYVPIDAGRPGATETAIAKIRAIRRGEEEPPYALSGRFETHIT